MRRRCRYCVTSKQTPTPLMHPNQRHQPSMSTTPCWSAARHASPVLRRSSTSEIPEQWAFVASHAISLLRVHRLRYQHGRLAYLARPAAVRLVRRIQVPFPQQDGLIMVAFMDDHYPVWTAFSLLNKVPTIISEIWIDSSLGAINFNLGWNFG
ncbi:hypothetical protein BDA96_05G081000 [Sorghum bicolor]|uniref:Uncharacterized protein n=1 Tax=Sorghum bicolor TaxID=4558 RepID=A0A921QVM9_SORBI|nr:hypothetical protein BDA96_05G081000 [Sorghum bicolor]